MENFQPAFRVLDGISHAHHPLHNANLTTVITVTTALFGPMGLQTLLFMSLNAFKLRAYLATTSMPES